MTTLLEATNTFSPALVRAVARRSTGKKYGGDTIPLTASEIALATGIPIGRVRRWLSSDDWSEVVGELSKIFELVGVKFSCHYKAQKDYLRRTSRKSWPLAHLSKLPKKYRDRTINKLNA